MMQKGGDSGSMGGGCRSLKGLRNITLQRPIEKAEVMFMRSQHGRSYVFMTCVTHSETGIGGDDMSLRSPALPLSSLHPMLLIIQ
jgi:hypothetical protein